MGKRAAYASVRVCVLCECVSPFCVVQSFFLIKRYLCAFCLAKILFPISIKWNWLANAECVCVRAEQRFDGMSIRPSVECIKTCSLCNNWIAEYRFSSSLSLPQYMCVCVFLLLSVYWSTSNCSDRFDAWREEMQERRARQRDLHQ